ncbi:MAG TPA: hypothetical protein VH165_05120 [Kofleriaceae bacterium]|jgi:hypothetical protein|nr:hypothetical protein [Kofleriaceae bacterium]
MTDPFIRDLAKLLEGRLAEPVTTEDDFIRLASTGEPVRRAVALLDAVPADVASLLAAYEASLVAFHGPTPSTLLDDAIAIAADLTAYRAVDDEDGDAALSLILELDAIVSAVVAAERTGRLPHGTAEALAARLEQTLAGVSYRAPHLAQLAEDRWLTVGDDPDLVGAYGWLDVLAEVAPSRARTAAVVKAATEHERRIDDTMAILSRARPTDRARSSFDRLPPFTIAQHVQPARFATANVAVPKQTPLVEDEDLSVFLEESGAELHLVVAFVPPLWIDDAHAALDGVALSRVNTGPHEFRFALPDHGGQLRLELQLDDDVVSHELELRRPT